MRQARSAGQLPVRAQASNSARPITGQMMNSQRIMQGTVTCLSLTARPGKPSAM